MAVCGRSAMWGTAPPHTSTTHVSDAAADADAAVNELQEKKW